MKNNIQPLQLPSQFLLLSISLFSLFPVLVPVSPSNSPRSINSLFLITWFFLLGIKAFLYWIYSASSCIFFAPFWLLPVTFMPFSNLSTTHLMISFLIKFCRKHDMISNFLICRLFNIITINFFQLVIDNIIHFEFMPIFFTRVKNNIVSIMKQ